MSAAVRKKAVITENTVIAEDILSMWLKAEEIAREAGPGQFVLLYCKDGSRLLPRPISICETDREQGKVRLVYRIAGSGTREFSRMKPQETIEVMGPLGNGFHPEGRKALLIGGGIGIPPLLELAKQLDCEKQIILGYRNITFLEKEFEPYGRVYISTEDGSRGTGGNVLDAVRANLLDANALQKNKLDADIIFACGPVPMLRGIKAFALEKKIAAQLSLEERMACGIGACLGCVCRTAKVDLHSNVDNKRVCKDGPIFYADEVEL